MSDVFACVQDAVRMARDEHIHSVAKLRSRLQDRGYTKETADAALTMWADYERRKNIRDYE